MRVTNNMISDTVVFNMQRSLRRFMDVQTNLSSGRRINRPSDDPIGTLRDLDYRAELSKLSQFQKNITEGQNWMLTYDSVLSEVSDILSNAKEISVTMSNSTYDAAQRNSSALEVRALFDRLVQLSESKLGDRNMFSGYKTKTKPFLFSANGVIYRGDSGKIQSEIESSVRTTINLSGAKVFLTPFTTLGKDADLDIGLSVNDLLANLNGGTGVGLTPGSITITDENLNTVSTVDLSAATTINDVITTINNQMTTDGMGITVALGDEGNNLEIIPTQTGKISLNTKLAKLHNGAGFSPPINQFQISDGGAINVSIDLSTAKTVGDVITSFNSQMVTAGYPAVTLGINAAGNGFVVTDSSGTPLNLTISDPTNEDSTANQLGIAGFVGNSLIGVALNPEPGFLISDTSGTTAKDLGITGQVTHDSPGKDINPQLTTLSLLADISSRRGVDNGKIIIWQGDRSLEVDMSDPALVTIQDFINKLNGSSLDITASINSAGTGVQIKNNDSNRSFTIEDMNGGRAAKEMDLFGSSDIMGSLLVLINTLKADDSDGVSRLLEGFDNAITQALGNRATIGTNSNNLESTNGRLVDLELNFTRLLSEVEDADLTEVVSQLAILENNYQAALMAAGKIVQPSLLDFLR